MNSLDVAYRAAQHYPGGAAALAVRMGKSASTLQKELRGDPGYKFGLLDAETLDAFVGGHPILNRQARDAGFMLLPLPSVDAAGECMLQAIGQVTREMGEYITAVGESLTDGVVSDNELARCQQELGELIQRAQQVQALLLARNLTGKPEQERRQGQGRRASDRK